MSRTDLGILRYVFLFKITAFYLTSEMGLLYYCNTDYYTNSFIYAQHC